QPGSVEAVAGSARSTPKPSSAIPTGAIVTQGRIVPDRRGRAVPSPLCHAGGDVKDERGNPERGAAAHALARREVRGERRHEECGERAPPRWSPEERPCDRDVRRDEQGKGPDHRDVEDGVAHGPVSGSRDSAPVCSTSPLTSITTPETV